MNKTWTLKTKVDGENVSVQGLAHEDAAKAIYRAMTGQPVLPHIDPRLVVSENSVAA